MEHRTEKEREQQDPGGGRSGRERAGSESEETSEEEEVDDEEEEGADGFWIQCGRGITLGRGGGGVACIVSRDAMGVESPHSLPAFSALREEHGGGAREPAAGGPDEAIRSPFHSCLSST